MIVDCGLIFIVSKIYYKLILTKKNTVESQSNVLFWGRLEGTLL